MDKSQEEATVWREKTRRLYPEKRRDAIENSKKVLKVTFRCNNCNSEWFFEYPGGIRVGYSSFGLPENENGWITDDFTYDNSLYDYKCQKCEGTDIKIVRRESL